MLCECNTDHPRSRGVYTSKGRPALSASGSSPLARGLLINDITDGGAHRIIPARAGFTVERQAGPVRLGIIPARAGFTSCGIGSVFEGADHPRSRGVYGVWADG